MPCLSLPPTHRVPVKVVTVYRDEMEVNAARPGENLRLRLQGIEEEDISAGRRGGGEGERAGRGEPVSGGERMPAHIHMLVHACGMSLLPKL